jgi:hypothetical protein
LRHLAQEDIVVMALIEDIDEDKEVEVSKEAWPLVIGDVNAGVYSVTIALESGASPMASGPFPNRQTHSGGHWPTCFVTF